ncbi:MAG: hypothetical protein HY329_19895 [Chloroflexi bacterium]|nr:hypothetical protein [Chloroflexota bacterium]
MNLGTCMDYTIDPAGTIQRQRSNEHPNRHDYQELQAIYEHLDTITTVGASGAALDGSFTPSESQRGINRFVAPLPGGGWLVSWVIWIP